MRGGAEESNGELQNDYRNSIHELWDNDAYTMINGIKVSGGARGHYIRRHGLAIGERQPQIEDIAKAEEKLKDILMGIILKHG